MCKKKVGLTGFTCRCGGLFCSIHRYSDKHQCDFDYKVLSISNVTLQLYLHINKIPSKSSLGVPSLSETNLHISRLSGPRRSARVTRWLLHRKWQKFNWSLKKVWSESSQNVLTVHFSLQKVINSAEMISLRSVQVKKFAISRSRTSDYRVTWLETALWLSSYFHIFRECLFGDSKYGYLGTFWRSSVFSKRPEVFKLNTNISY